ncbi:MAG: hypothetical protein ACXWHC_15110 [Usitatibacter sp.]
MLHLQRSADPFPALRSSRFLPWVGRSLLAAAILVLSLPASAARTLLVVGDRL